MALVFSAAENPTYDPRVALCQLVLRTNADGKFGRETERVVRQFQETNGLAVTGTIEEATGRKMDLTMWDAQLTRQLQEPFRDAAKFAASHEFVFRTYVAGGYFASKPDSFVADDARRKRSIRTNNPGALNIGEWQKAMPGYVGRTQADASSQANKTTIYLSPEDGIVAWYVLIVHRYERAYGLISGGTGTSINIKRLAKAYGLGAPNRPDSQLSDRDRSVVNYYLAGWRKWSVFLQQPLVLDPATEVRPGNASEMCSLANAMFSHECGLPTPLLDAQIEGGLQRARNWANTGSSDVPAVTSDYGSESASFDHRSGEAAGDIEAEEAINAAARYDQALQQLQEDQAR